MRCADAMNPYQAAEDKAHEFGDWLAAELLRTGRCPVMVVVKDYGVINALRYCTPPNSWQRGPSPRLAARGYDSTFWHGILVTSFACENMPGIHFRALMFYSGEPLEIMARLEAGMLPWTYDKRGVYATL